MKHFCCSATKSFFSHRWCQQAWVGKRASHWLLSWGKVLADAKYRQRGFEFFRRTPQNGGDPSGFLNNYLKPQKHQGTLKQGGMALSRNAEGKMVDSHQALHMDGSLQIGGHESQCNLRPPKRTSDVGSLLHREFNHRCLFFESRPRKAHCIPSCSAKSREVGLTLLFGGYTPNGCPLGRT